MTNRLRFPAMGRVNRLRFTPVWAMAGILLAVALAGWVLLSAAGVPGARPAPVLGLIGVTALAVALGWLAGRSTPMSAALGTAVVVAAILASGAATLAAAAGGPLGYANANAHLAGLGVVAALASVLASFCLGWPDEGRPGRSGSEVAAGRRPEWLVLAVRGSGAIAGLALAAFLVAVLVIPTSKAAVAYLVAVVGLGAVALWLQWPRLVVLGGAAAVAVSLGGTLAVAVGAAPDHIVTLTAARGDLWAGAVEVVVDHPVRGVGPGRFSAVNPVTHDPDLRWVHHGYLQATAELGVPGGALSLAVLGWGYVGLWWAAGRAGRDSVTVVVGAAALTYLALHATVDYVLHFPVLVVTAAALVGWSLGSEPSAPQ